MEIVLIINGVLASFTMYFVKDFHQDFKKLSKTVNELKASFLEHTLTIREKVRNNSKRLDELEKQAKE